MLIAATSVNCNYYSGTDILFTGVKIGIGIRHRNFFCLNIGTLDSEILHESPNSDKQRSELYRKVVHKSLTTTHWNSTLNLCIVVCAEVNVKKCS